MKREFKAESKRLMELMIHSIYTNKEVFLRELISNASDATDKYFYTAVSAGETGLSREDFPIVLTKDKDARLLTISDKGIGMNDKEMEENLGVIAASGSLKFRDEIEAETAELAETDIIGRFGVGFYSSFIVADNVKVISRKRGEDKAWMWESDGIEGYTITETEKAEVGTDVILHIREDGEEKDEYSRFLREYPLYKLVRKYSDYIRYPIRMLMPHPVLKEGNDPQNPEYEEIFEYETLNSMTPIWQRSKGEVTKEEYDRFFIEHFNSPVPPRRVITAAVEGTVTYKALLYIPGSAPKGYNTDEYKSGLQLYSAGVLIMDDCRALLPEHFNFVRGIVDSPDLNLNISREMLQQDRQVSRIAANLEKKIKAELLSMLRDDRKEYESFYKDFGRQMKLCALDNYGKDKEKIQDLLLFWSSMGKQLVTLDEYVDNMPEEQKYIYYAAGSSIDAIDRMPQTEIIKDNKMEILYFVEKTDEFIADMFVKYKEKAFRSVLDGDIGLNDDTKAKEKEFKELFAFAKEVLGGKVDEIIVSTRLKNHPVCLSSGQGITFEMEKYFRQMAANLPQRAKRILELNVEHPAVRALNTTRVIDRDKAAKYVTILYNQACLIAGLPIDDPTEYTDLLVSLWR